jgi:hypothetical protein
VSKRTFESFLEFGQALIDAGVSQVVRREVHEIRPRTAGGHAVVVGRVDEVTWLAYHRGEVLQCTVPAEEAAGCVAWLEARSIGEKVVSGNIG